MLLETDMTYNLKEVLIHFNIKIDIFKNLAIPTNLKVRMQGTL